MKNKMSNFFTTLFLLLILRKTSSLDIISSTKQALEAIQMTQSMIFQTINGSSNNNGMIINQNYSIFINDDYQRMAWSDCAKLYDLAEPRLTRLLGNRYTDVEDAVAWLSGALTSHRTCLDGLRDRGVHEAQFIHSSQNLSHLLNDALALFANNSSLGEKTKRDSKFLRRRNSDRFIGELTSWNPVNSRADIVVAKDGTGDYMSIQEAMDALHRITSSRRQRNRVVVYVKEGIYNENVEIKRKITNVMLIGDGIDKTVVTARRNFVDGHTTVGSATFAVYSDGFWARDMTFENTAGPQKHQAVALFVASDLSLFYRCSFKGYQDTLYVHSLRQFYRDCQIYGTIDFIFGNAAVVIQNCDIFVRRPMAHQSNMITAQGRETPYENTGITIHRSQILPAPDFAPVKGLFRTFLGRPWKMYARTVVARTYLDRFIHPKGWSEWDGNFALSTLYYGEYMNTGRGAYTWGRVRWDGFHVLRDRRQVSPFTVMNFIQGGTWIGKSGVPIWYEI